MLSRCSSTERSNSSVLEHLIALGHAHIGGDHLPHEMGALLGDVAKCGDVHRTLEHRPGGAHFSRGHFGPVHHRPVHHHHPVPQGRCGKPPPQADEYIYPRTHGPCTTRNRPAKSHPRRPWLSRPGMHDHIVLDIAVVPDDHLGSGVVGADGGVGGDKTSRATLTAPIRSAVGINLAVGSTWGRRP